MNKLFRNVSNEAENLALYSEIRKSAEGKDVNLADVHWLELYDYLEQQENAFVSRLSALHPQLSDSHIKLCMLVRLGLPNKVLADIFHVSETSIKQRLLRMKRPLGIAGENTSARVYLIKY